MEGFAEVPGTRQQENFDSQRISHTPESKFSDNKVNGASAESSMQPLIGIIGGQGQMGRLFTSFFKERNLKVIISDQKTKLSNSELAAKCDITIVSVPMDKTEAVIREIAPHMPKESALMDFTSLKEFPLKAMCKAKCEVCGIHPMFGGSNPIPGQTIIICPTKKSGKWTKWMKDFLKTNGVIIKEMSAKENDKMMAVTQAMIHFADFAFADSLRRTKMPIKKILPLASKASELKIQLAARLINQDSNLYGNMQILNKDTLKYLKQHQKSVTELIKIVQKKDLKAFQKYFAKNKAFLKSYCQEAYDDSSYLIDKFIQKKRKSTAPSPAKPTKTALALLGPRNTFSHIAATNYSPKGRKCFARDIEEVFELVAAGKVKEGLVPIENKLNGTVRESLDNLFSKNVHIASETSLPIHHTLITLPHAKATDIKTVISHSQALNQCKKFLKNHFPKVSKQSYSSTGSAIEKLLISQDKSIAVIAPAQAASSLKILHHDIQDQCDNSTKFILIRKGKHKSNPQAKKTFIAFYFDADSPGSLFSVFEDFAKAKINMTKIESRPTQSKFGDYIFYLDFEGNSSQPKIAKTLKKLSKKVAKLKILGSA
ncbi:prephenate dehydratase [Candidatus Gracilibacteria bacterium]|nr:prephenate dehydratase [Candidatus Gracilibacteria bacterium]